MSATANSDAGTAFLTKTKTRRSDAGKPRAKKPGAALIDVIAALDGLSASDMLRVLDAAKIFFDLKAEVNRPQDAVR